MVLLHWTRWLPELKIEKIFKWHLILGQWLSFKIFAQKCSSNSPLPKLLKQYCLAEQNWWPELKTFKRLLLCGQWPNFYFPATVLFTCIKSWFFRNHLANFHQISHWSHCWNRKRVKVLPASVAIGTLKVMSVWWLTLALLNKLRCHAHG